MNELNFLLKSFIEENNIYDISFFDRYKKLNEIILKFPEPQYHNICKNRFGLSKSINNVYDFLKNIDINLSEEFINRVNSFDYSFKKIDCDIKFNNNYNSYSEYDLLENRKKVVIFYQEDVFDSFTILHEFFHDYNLDFKNINITRKMFTEFISIYSEFLFEKYIKLNIGKCSYNNKLCNFWLCFYDCLKVDFLIKILECYMKNGCINDWFFNNIILLYDNKYHEVLKDYILSIIINNEVDLFKKFKYIFGILLSCYVDVNDILSISDFLEINNSINDLKVKDLFNIFDLDILDNYSFELTDDSYNKLCKSYKKKLNSR